MSPLTIEIPVRLWHRIDGCVDNSMTLGTVDRHDEAADFGLSVRQAGWRASAAHVGAHDAGGWPPGEHLLEIALSIPQWRWVVSQLDRWSPFVADGFAEDAEVRAIIIAELTNP